MKCMKQLKKNTGGCQTFRRIDLRERVIIENRYCIDMKSMRNIALELNRPVSSVSREIRGKPRLGVGKYSAYTAQSNSGNRRENQGRKSKLVYQPLKNYVVDKMKLGWSPEQISLRLPIEYSQDREMRISYEAIYQYVYAQVHRGGNGMIKKNCEDLRKYLIRRHTRRQRKGFRQARRLEQESVLPSIEVRPKEVLKRKIIGHWEDDTIVSRQSKFRVKSINERVSGLAFFGRTINGKAEECDSVVIERLKNIPANLRKTLTRDRGKENFGYKMIEEKLGISCFFAHPYCSQERGSNENVNGLFRRYFPKKTDFAKVKDQEIARVEHLINTRPRKRHCGFTPYEVFYQMTGVALDS